MNLSQANQRQYRRPKAPVVCHGLVCCRHVVDLRAPEMELSLVIQLLQDVLDEKVLSDIALRTVCKPGLKAANKTSRNTYYK